MKVPPIIIKMAIARAIGERSAELLRQSSRGEITHQAFLASNFPCDGYGYLNEAIDKAVKEWEEGVEELKKEYLKKHKEQI